MTPLKAASLFIPKASISALDKLDGGNVNDTFLLVDTAGLRFILQRINPEVFPCPEHIMANFEIVTGCLGQQRDRRPNKISAGSRVVTLFPTISGGKSIRDSQGGLWRMMGYIDNTHTKKNVVSSDEAYDIGQNLGYFHCQVSSIDSGTLQDTLPGFHITPGYLAEYDTHRNNPEWQNTHNSDIQFCRDFITRRRHCVDILGQAKAEGVIRQQVIHGDPKPANFLFDNETGKVVTLIDFDTVKDGLLLYDIGDCLRSCCNTAGEDKKDSGIAVFATEMCQAVLQGYFSEAGKLLSRDDIKLIFDSVHLITFELGLRFFTDYLAGNRYFKVHYDDQNLQRARTQFRLVESIETQEKAIRRIVDSQCSNSK